MSTTNGLAGEERSTAVHRRKIVFEHVSGTDKYNMTYAPRQKVVGGQEVEL
jgi:hypothetical protein